MQISIAGGEMPSFIIKLQVHRLNIDDLLLCTLPGDELAFLSFCCFFFFLVWQVLHHEHARKSENSRKQQNTNLINREDVKLIFKSLNQHISEALFFLELMVEETSCIFLICVVSWSSGGPMIQEANLWQEGCWFKSPDRIALTGMIVECLLHPPNPSVRFP